MSKQKKTKNFEEALESLEQIVSELESGNLGLDDSLNKFEEGLKSYQQCKELLESAEKKISILTKNLKEDEI